MAAAATEQDPAQQRNVFPPGEGVIAFSAMRARRYEAFVLREAGQEDVEKAAECDSEERCKDCAKDLELMFDFSLSPVLVESMKLG
jgi:hypothetical protein